jgi:hypothetical protein
MKKFSVVFVFTLVISALAISQTIDYPKISIKKKKFMIGKQEVTSNWSINNIISELGPADRKKEGYNITHTYDNLGILLFENVSNKQATGTAAEIQIHFNPESNEVNPKNGYMEDIRIDKLKVNREVTSGSMLVALGKWKKTDSYIENAYRMSNGFVYVYFQFTPDELRLQKISIGKETSK